MQKNSSTEKSRCKFKKWESGGRMTENKSEPVWRFQHFVNCNAPRQFAWSHWTDIANWNDPPASFHLDGPFNVGSRLTTSLPGQTLQSVIREVINESRTDEATIDMQLPGAILSFQWKFESLFEDRTRITQRLTLSGANAEALVAQASMLEKSTPEGMEKLVAAIERSMKAE
jgi:hypothetical protein